MHIKVVFSDTHLLKVSYFLFKILNLICNATFNTPFKCVNYVLDDFQSYFWTLTLNFIYNIALQLCQLCCWRFSKLILEIWHWTLSVILVSYCVNYVLEDFQSYIRNMTLNFICNTAFWTKCQLCSWMLSKFAWYVMITAHEMAHSANKFNILVESGSLETNLISWRWLWAALTESQVAINGCSSHSLHHTSSHCFLPPAKFKFILSWIFITARNNSGHDIMARSLCVTVRNEKWHVFAQGYLHDLVYWIFIIFQAKTSRNTFSTTITPVPPTQYFFLIWTVIVYAFIFTAKKKNGNTRAAGN